MFRTIDCGKAQQSIQTLCYHKEFEWTIEMFDDWWQSAKPKGKKNGNSWINALHSSDFKMEIGDETHIFKLSITKCHEEESKISTSLYYCGPLDSINVKTKWYLKSHGKLTSRLQYDNKSHDGESIDLFQSLDKDTYSEPYVESFENLKQCIHHESTSSSRVKFKDNSKYCDFTPLNSMVVKCKIQINVMKQSFDLSILKDALKQKKAWNENFWESFDFCIGEQGQGNMKQHSDFKILCIDEVENGKQGKTEFNCHKLMLSIGSPYFKKMFCSTHPDLSKDKMKWGETGIVEMLESDISSNTFALFLQYIYTGKLLPKTVTEELLCAAHKYQVDPLQALCEYELAEQITVESAAKLAALADLCGSPNFKKFVYKFVAKHWKQIKDKERFEWIENNENNKELICEIFDSI